MPRLIHLNTRAGRLAVFSFLYLSEGIPVGFSTIALAAYLRQLGTGLTEVGAIVAAVYAPWAFKWAWAPLVDLIRIRSLGPSRAWILFAQVMMIATIAALLGFDLASNIPLLTTLTIIHNAFAATQDVAIDAMAVRVLPDNEVGTANGFMFAAQFLGIGIGGSGALYIAGLAGFQAGFYFVLALMTLLLVTVTIPLREPPDPQPPLGEQGAPLASEIIDRVRTFFQELYRGFFKGGTGPLAGVIFSILPPGATALGLALLTTIQVDMKLSEETIASVALATNGAAAAGSIFGGWLSDRTGRPRACIAVFYALTAVPTLYLALRLGGPQGVAGLAVMTFTAGVVLYNLFYGMQQGTVTALFMRITNPAVAATQFTGYMALHNLALTYSSLWQGRVADSSGYSTALRIDALVAVAALTVLPWVVAKKRTTEAVEEPHPAPVRID